MNQSANGSRVVVLGAINVDLVVAAATLPGPGETVTGSGLKTFGGGKGANAAVAAARAGAEVVLVGAVGKDAHGVSSIENLKSEGIDTSYILVLEDEATGVALIVVDDAGENQIAVGLGANAALTIEHVERSFNVLLENAGCVLVSTEIPEDVIAYAVRAAAGRGVLCILNPAPVLPVVLEILSAGPILTPNGGELTELALRLAHSACTSAIEGAQIINAVSGNSVVTTLGAEGALVLQDAENHEVVPSQKVVARDTTGAGDTFNGVLATWLAQGAMLSEAVKVAVVAASLSVTRVGARDGMPSRELILETLQNR
jgi:ribokinase